jgi:hypothetical protein
MESCERHGFDWSEVDVMMRFWCEIYKSRLDDDLIDEWNSDDGQKSVACVCVACEQQSSSVQPASSKICSNVGKGPQQSSIVEDNERMLEEEADPSPPGSKITDGVVFVQSSSSSTAKDDIEGKGLSALKISNIVEKGPFKPIVMVEDKKEDKKEVDDEKMMVDDDESSSLQTLINPEAYFSSTSAKAFLLATSSSSAEIALPATSSSSAEIALPATSSSSAESFLPATSRSSAETALLATTALPATSSNANSSCTDIMDIVILSSDDYYHIANIADQLFSDIAADNFSGSVLCLYAQALRTHFMTHTHFKHRDTYKRLNAVTTYKQHKEFFFMLAGDFTIADVRLNLPTFDGLRTIEHAVRSMLPDRDFTFLNGFELTYIGPGKYQKEVEKEAVNAMNKAFSNFLDQKILSTAEVKVDLSLLLVDFKEFDGSKGTPCVSDFPNRIVVSLEKYPRDIYAYQTVGGLYKKFDSKGDIFAMRIVSRERMGGEYVVHQYFSNNNTTVPIASKQLSYIDEWESEPYYVTLENQKRDKKDCSRSHFPAIINVSKSEKFYLTGAVLCLNEGPEAGLTASEDVLPDVQNSLSQLDPVFFNCCGHTIFAREIRICHDTRKWFSDEIMLPATEKFLVKRATEHQDQD